MIAVDPTETHSFFLPWEEGKPEATEFNCGPLKEGDYTRASGLIASAQEAAGLAFACRQGLKGWRYLANAKGQAVAFPTDGTALDYLPGDAREAIGMFILSLSKIREEDRGKLPRAYISSLSRRGAPTADLAKLEEKESEKA